MGCAAGAAGTEDSEGERMSNEELIKSARICFGTRKGCENCVMYDVLTNGKTSCLDELVKSLADALEDAIASRF